MNKELITMLESEGYQQITLKNGILCGVLDFVATRGIVVGLSRMGYEHRYCYQERAEADVAFASWNGTGYAPGNWIKLKGLREGKAVDVLNPNWCRSNV